MNKISEITRQDILDIIKNGIVEEFDEPVYDFENSEYISEIKYDMPFYGRLDEISFFKRLYNLEELPSYDSRFKTALDDISCHLRFGDYEDFWFFNDERFKLKEGDGDEPLLAFMCEMLHPAVRIEKSQWIKYLDSFNALLRPDGYELYVARYVSGRAVYEARTYDVNNMLFPANLFSERYKELIHTGNGTPVDNISDNLSFQLKQQLAKVMLDFAEPMLVQRNRYDGWKDDTDALTEAIQRFNEYLGIPLVDLKNCVLSGTSKDVYLASQFTPYLFDIVELQFDELSNQEKHQFRQKINAELKKCKAPFNLSDGGLIELQNGREVLSLEIIENIGAVKEKGIQELLDEAIKKHMQPTFESHRDAAEKMWDALERLKTYYTSMDKAKSAEKIVYDMANGNSDFIKIFDTEFRALTTIGNDFRIRHHETNKIDITDIRHYDYFFNRCLALISVAILYLE